MGDSSLAIGHFVGLSLDREMRVAGYSLTTIKNALRGFARTRSPGNLIDLKTLFPLRRRDGAIVFEECLDRGLIDAEARDVTESGQIIARAKAQRRTPLPRAQALLDEFLLRVEALNQNAEGVRYVDRVWLFGSLMRGEATVGDIDLALELSRRPDFANDSDDGEKRLTEALAKYPDRPENLHYSWQQESWLMNRALHGARRHALFAGVQDGIEDLVSLHTPCQLIYDRERGGLVQDPVLPHHPRSTRRGNDLKPLANMPDIVPRPIRPMDGRWAAGYSTYGEVSPYHIFRDWNDEAHQLFPRYPESLRVLGDDHLPEEKWTSKRLQAKGLDGREAIALADLTPNLGVSIVLNRKIERQAATWSLCASFSDLEFQDRRQRTAPLALLQINAAAALILAVDAERMLRRAAELPTPPAIQIRFETSDHPGDQISRDFVAHVRELLADGAIRIAPTGWQSERSIVLQG